MTNAPPTASAGLDHNVARHTRVVLDGRQSRDPEGAALTYAWLVTAAPATSTAQLVAADTATPEIVVDAVGFYDVALTVSDGVSTSAPDVARIAVMDGLPLADAGNDVTLAKGATAALDGSGSVDPDGDPLSYAWTITSRPQGSSAALVGATTATPSLATDVPGTYRVELVVSDGAGSSTPDAVVVTATNAMPVADAGPDRELQLGATASLGGTSTDADGDPLTYAWTITNRPAGSVAALATPTAAHAALTPDVAGEYDVQLTVSDGFATATDTVQVLVETVVTDLGAELLDAEYATSLGRIVALTADARVLIVNPTTGAITPIALPLAGTSLSISPDGTRAIVGHNAWITVIDLPTATITHTFPVAVPVGDAIDGGNGFAYVLPSADQWVAVHSVNLTTGADTASGQIYAGDRGRKAPGMDAIYIATNGLSPSNMERYETSGGVATYGHASPYWGDYPFCGAMWFAEDGARVFTRCGNVFHTTSNAASDMTYAGSLGGAGAIASLSHSAAASKIAALYENDWNPPDEDTSLYLYADPFLTPAGTKPLPVVLANHALVPSHGQFVFADADGVTVHVVTHVDATPPRTLLWSTTY